MLSFLLFGDYGLLLVEINDFKNFRRHSLYSIIIYLIDYLLDLIPIVFLVLFYKLNFLNIV